MTPDEIAQWSALAGQIGGNGLLLLGLVGLLRGWVVTKQHYDDMERLYRTMLERERAKVTALRDRRP